MSQLDAALIAAHDRADPKALAMLYRDAADLSEQRGDLDAACFYLTQAHVFALEAGDTSAAALRQRLIAHGREADTSVT